MPDAALPSATLPSADARAGAFEAGTCGNCLGAGGWFRYEPSLEPAPGQLYLSCLDCRGNGADRASAGLRTTPEAGVRQ